MKILDADGARKVMITTELTELDTLIMEAAKKHESSIYTIIRYDVNYEFLKSIGYSVIRDYPSDEPYYTISWERKIK